MRRSLVAALFAAMLLTVQVHAQAPSVPGSWLDGPVANWNAPGMPTPKAPSIGWGAIRTDVCPDEPLRLNTPEGDAVAAAGWYRVTELASGWGVTLLYAQQGTDGMCRPSGYQVFVFVDGVLAGSISPRPMGARLDGDGEVIAIGRDLLLAEYLRYGPNDPLCCPSRAPTRVWFRIQRTDSGPLLVPQP